MGGLFSQPSPPPVPPPPPLPPAAIPPTMANAAVTQSGQNQKAQAAGAAGKGMGGTIATGPQGDLTKTTSAKNALAANPLVQSSPLAQAGVKVLGG